jgi:hypothetical protein
MISLGEITSGQLPQLMCDAKPYNVNTRLPYNRFHNCCQRQAVRRVLGTIFQAVSGLWKPKMNLRGGVIIIGSLLWENAARADWRSRSLKPLDTKVPVPLRVRYGRESGGKRCHRYTMILSNHAAIGAKGYIQVQLDYMPGAAKTLSQYSSARSAT